MVGIAEKLPRQLAPSVGSASTRFCHPGGILHYQRHQDSNSRIQSGGSSSSRTAEEFLYASLRSNLRHAFGSDIGADSSGQIRAADNLCVLKLRFPLIKKRKEDFWKRKEESS
jgi:hypothetical protein